MAIPAPRTTVDPPPTPRPLQVFGLSLAQISDALDFAYLHGWRG